MQNIDLSTLSADQLRALQTSLTPRLNKYIPTEPTAKQSAFLLCNTVKEVLYGGAAGGGKALDINTPILTANRGWQTMETILIGDYVFGRDGKPTRVVMKSPIFFNHDCYKLRFDNDEEIVADAEHLWQIDEYRNRYSPQIMTTEDIYDTMIDRTAHVIYKASALEYPEVDLECHPYAFGVWLGDGAKYSGEIACTDTEIHENLESLGYDIYQTKDIRTWKSHKLRRELRSMGFLGDVCPMDKYIPQKYMTASKAQRMMLLWGLMDTDGNASSDRGYVSICMTDINLMLQIEELVRSLGIKVTLRTSVATCGQTGAQSPKYNLKWSTPVRMFTLPYKYARQKKTGFRGTQDKHYIKDVQRVPSVPTQCIQVDNIDHIYLAGDSLIPTHNSVAMLMAALQYVDIPGYNAILFRKTFSDLMLPGALIPMSQEWMSPWIEKGLVTWKDKDKKYIFYESGATLSFGYLDAQNDHYRYQGSEYQFIGIDEVTHINPDSYTYMFSRLRRSKKVQAPLRFRASANPGGEFGDFYYNRFFVDNEDNKRLFIPAGLKDNPHLDAEEYRQSLAELDDVTREQLENGNWQIRAKGDLFEKNWIIGIAPEGIPTYARRVRYWDLAAIDPKKRRKTTNKKAPDWTVGFKLAHANGMYYIEDIIAVQKSPGDVEELIKATAAADGTRCAIRMEQEPGASGIQTIDHYLRSVLPGYDFAGVLSTGSKYERARQASTACQVGIVFINQRCRNLTMFYNQLDSFPNGSNDDCVDGFSGAFNYFRPNTSIKGTPPRVRGEKSYWRD